MFDKQQWMQWAENAKKSDPKMKDFRNGYWHAQNVQEQGTNNVDSLADAARRVMESNAPVELDEGVGKAVAAAAGNPVVRAAAAGAASKVASKIKASIAKKKSKDSEEDSDEEQKENAAKKLYAGYGKSEGAGEENRAKGVKKESMMDDEESADEDDERKAGKADDKKENMELAPRGKGRKAASKLYAGYGKSEGAGEENRAKGVKKESADLEEAAPLIGMAARAGMGMAVDAIGKKFAKNKQGGEDSKEESALYASKLKRKRLAMKK
tara:strand:- start:301 stop:1104 length:804 start_codon:yes stop_codon:yes gene_type:complete